MKATTMIHKLQQLVDKHGDQPVSFRGRHREVYAGTIEPYDEDGNYPTARYARGKGCCVQFFIYGGKPYESE